MSIIAIHHAAAAELSEHAPKPTAITEGQTEAAHTAWNGGKIHTGLWECTPGTFLAERNGYTEICTILSGRATIEVDEGQSEEFAAGDILVMPSGWKGVWRIHETLRKHYTIVDD